MAFVIPVPGNPILRSQRDLMFALQRTQALRAADSKVAAKKQKAIRKRNALTAVASVGAAFGGLSALGAIGSAGATTGASLTAAGGIGGLPAGALGAAEAAGIAASGGTLGTTVAGLGSIGLEALRGSQIAGSIGSGVIDLFDSSGGGVGTGISKIGAGIKALQAPRLAANKLSVKRQGEMQKRRFKLEDDELRQMRGITSKHGKVLGDFQDEADELGLSFGEYDDVLNEEKDARTAARKRLEREQASELRINERKILDEWDLVESVARQVPTLPENLFEAARKVGQDPYKYVGNLKTVLDRKEKNHDFRSSVAQKLAEAGLEGFNELRGNMDEFDFSPYLPRVAEIQAIGQRVDRIRKDPVNFQNGGYTDIGMQRLLSETSLGFQQFAGVQKKKPPITVKDLEDRGTTQTDPVTGDTRVVQDGEFNLLRGTSTDVIAEGHTRLSVDQDGRTWGTTNIGGQLISAPVNEAGPQLDLKQRLSVRKAAEASIKFERDALSDDDKDELGPITQGDVFRRMELLESGSSPMQKVTRRERPAEFSQFDGLRQQLDDRKQVAAPVAPTPTKKDQALDLLARGVPATQWPDELKKSQRPLLEKARDDLIVKLKAGTATAAEIEQGEIISRLLK